MTAEQFSVDPNVYNIGAFTDSGNGTLNGYDFGSSFANFFTGIRDSDELKFANKKELYDRLYEQANLNSARNYEMYMDNTKVQRAVEDIKKAGLNPYLAIQSGVNGSSAVSSPSIGSSSANKHLFHKKEKSDFADLLSSAAKIMLIAALK